MGGSGWVKVSDSSGGSLDVVDTKPQFQSRSASPLPSNGESPPALTVQPNVAFLPNSKCCDWRFLKQARAFLCIDNIDDANGHEAFATRGFLQK